jgi:hypothetical protein
MKIFLALFAVMFVLTATPAMAKKVLLKVPVTFSTALPGLGDGILYMANNIDELSAGNVKMKVYEPKKTDRSIRNSGLCIKRKDQRRLFSGWLLDRKNTCSAAVFRRTFWAGGR